MTDGTLCDLNGLPRTTRVQYVCYPTGNHEIYSLKGTNWVYPSFKSIETKFFSSHYHIYFVFEIFILEIHASKKIKLLLVLVRMKENQNANGTFEVFTNDISSIILSDRIIDMWIRSCCIIFAIMRSSRLSTRGIQWKTDKL